MNDLKAWEKNLIKNKENLWLVTTRSEKLVCTKAKGDFFVKSSPAQLVDGHYIIKTEKL